MSLADYTRDLLAIGIGRPENYILSFAKRSKLIQDSLVASDSVKSEFLWDGSPDGLNRLKFASIFSDIVSVVTCPQPGGRRFFDVFGNTDIPLEQLDVPSFIFEREKERGVKARQAYMSFQDATLQQALGLISPLMERGSVVLRPQPVLIVPGSVTNGVIQGVEFWGVPSRSHREAVATVTHSENPTAYSCFQVTVPFFEGISIPALARLLESEQDTLVRARAAIRNSLRQATSDKLNMEEYAQDVLAPEMEALNMRLSRLRRHQLFAAAGLVSVTLTLMLTGTTPFWQVLPTGLEFFNSVTDANNLRESPYYFWWRVQRAQR
ncbi:MAG: hypothetical protein KGZ53_06750 [Peptococcaceae bacterium]|nr:hypothetical protein [Peptococcaceae bacterium]